MNSNQLKQSMISVIFILFLINGTSVGQVWEQKDADDFKTNPDELRNKLSEDILNFFTRTSSVPDISRNFTDADDTLLSKLLFTVSDKVQSQNANYIVAGIKQKLVGSSRLAAIALALSLDIARKDQDKFIGRANKNWWINFTSFLINAYEYAARISDKKLRMDIRNTLIPCSTLIFDALCKYLNNLDPVSNASTIGMLAEALRNITVHTTITEAIFMGLKADKKDIQSKIDSKYGIIVDFFKQRKTVTLNDIISKLNDTPKIDEDLNALEKSDLIVLFIIMRLKMGLFADQFKEVISKAQTGSQSEQLVSLNFITDFLIFIIKIENAIESKSTNKAALRSLYNSCLLSFLSNAFDKQALENLNSIPENPTNLIQVLPNIIFYITQKNLTECILHDITVAQAKVFALSAVSSLVSVAASASASLVPGIGGFAGALIKGITQKVTGEISTLIISAIASDFKISADGIITFLTTPNVKKEKLIQQLDAIKDSFATLIKKANRFIADTNKQKPLQSECDFFITRKWALEKEVSEETVEERKEKKGQRLAKEIVTESLGKKKTQKTSEIDELREKIGNLETRLQQVESKLALVHP